MMEAKRTALLLSIFLLAGCHRAALPEEGGVEVVFSILGEETRVTGTDGERAVDNWALLLYRDGRLVEAGTSDSGAAIRKRWCWTRDSKSDLRRSILSMPPRRADS